VQWPRGRPPASNGLVPHRYHDSENCEAKGLRPDFRADTQGSVTSERGAMRGRQKSRRPRRPADAAPGRRDDHHLVPARASRAGLLHDCVVAGAPSVHRVDSAVLTHRLATLGVSLEDQHDHVVAQVRCGDRLVEPLRRACAVTPPAVRLAADHVRAVDDEHAHAASLGERAKDFGGDSRPVPVGWRPATCWPPNSRVSTCRVAVHSDPGRAIEESRHRTHCRPGRPA